MISVVESL